jgi:chemosensory pili system protein ChpA (sensor histidine kinase/response regulator)
MTALTAPVIAPAEQEPTLVVPVTVKHDAVIEAASHQAPIQNRPVVRVSLEKLDDLANIVRSLVMSRSVFEQRLAEFELQVQELHNSTSRLQRSTSKLEIDFEANMLGLAPSRRSLLAAPVSITGETSETEFDTLEFDRYTDFHQTTRELVETASDNFAINSALDALRGNLEGFFENQRRQIEEVQEKLQRIRMIEFGTLAARLNRTVRVSCEEERKQAELVIEGEHLEIDTQILDSLIEPLMHLLRNAVAHGIEPPDTRRLLGKPEKGRIYLSAVNEDTHIVLIVSDDGRGILASELKETAVRNGYLSKNDADAASDEQILDLVFQPGLTTAREVSQTAGRGVGMNIVRTSIERQQGTVAVSSEPQKGTTFILQVPISLAVTRVLLVKANRQTFAFPLKKVKQIHEVGPDEAARLLAEKTVVVENSRYPVSSLNEHLGFSAPQNSGLAAQSLLILEVAGRTSALLVDEVVKPEEVLIKPLGRPLEDLKGVFGATILGNGQVVPVLDLTWYLRSRPKRSKAAAPVEVKNVETRPLSVMIVDDSPSVRHMNTRMVRGAGWLPVIARDGEEALELLRSGDSTPDIILSDVEMPRMDGYELLANLRQSGPWEKIPVVMITSRAGDKHREKAFELGVSEYLVKPYDDTKLLEIIRNLTSSK